MSPLTGDDRRTVLHSVEEAAGNRRITGPRSPGAREFREALAAVTGELARDLARDGEGATKLVDVRVRGARSRAQADRAAS